MTPGFFHDLVLIRKDTYCILFLEQFCEQKTFILFSKTIHQCSSQRLFCCLCDICSVLKTKAVNIAQSPTNNNFDITS